MPYIKITNRLPGLMVVRKRFVQPDEIRYNPDQPRDAHGRWTSAGSGLTGGGNGGTISSRPKPMRIGLKERSRLSHQIATDYPDLKSDGKMHSYSNRNHFYRFTVNGFGSYNFHLKIGIAGNEDYISSIRKKEE